jgi:hypothetical protein
VLFLVDACYSGIAGSEKSLQSLPPAGSLDEVARVSRQRARQVLTAGRGNETALELDSLGHGAFTFWVLKGLEGSADRNCDCYILGSELYTYVQPLVREATNYHQSPQYFLLPDGQDGDFVFALAPCSGARPLPTPPPEEPAVPGYLVVDTKPWVRIFVDNKYVGESPKCGISLPAGRHQLRLINEPRGVDKLLEVDIRPGETRYVVGAFELR